MELYIYPHQVSPTPAQLTSLRKAIVDSLINDATTWKKLDRNITDSMKSFYLFSHIKDQYKNEPFYLAYANNAVVAKFEINKDEGSKSMIIGMLVYYLRYHLRDQIRKIEVK